MNNDFTVNEFVAATRTSRPTIYRMIKAGELFAYKIRGATRIPFDELDRIRKDNMITTENIRKTNVQIKKDK